MINAWRQTPTIGLASIGDHAHTICLVLHVREFYDFSWLYSGADDAVHHLNPSDALSVSQRAFFEDQRRTFRNWWEAWPGEKS